MNIKIHLTTGDLDFTGGNMTMIEDLAEYRQKLQVRFRFFLGEWFLDTRVGIPYFTEIHGKGRDITTISATMQKAILTCPGIVKLDNFLLEQDAATRVLSVDFEATTVDGDIITGTDINFAEAFII